MAANIIKKAVPLLLVSIVWMDSASAQRSLYQDVKANREGDIITVVLMENITGSSTSDSRRATNADGNASGSVSGNFLPFEPVFGSGVSVNYDSDERNLASQRQLLQGHMSVQIVEVTDRGDLLVDGTRVMEINGETHTMNLSGTVRQRDIDSQNQVLSYKVANAVINYQKQGDIENLKNRRGLIKRIVFTGIGVALGAAIIIDKFR